MSHIDITKEHNLSTADVKKLVKTVADDLSKKYGGSYEMVETGTKFKGPGVEGAFEILDGAVRITATLGFLMRPLKGVIEKQINDEIDILMEKHGASEKPKAKKATAKKSTKS